MRFNFQLPVFFLAIFLFSCKNDPSGSDLTINVVGTYLGTTTLNLSTDSVKDISGQQVELVKLDNEHITLIPLIYPDESPADTVNLTTLLTPTPFGFIRTEGVMLTFEPSTWASGTINGSPYSITGGGTREAHGSYNRETGELVYALRIVKDGVEHYEIFQGSKE